jgi:glutamate-1-semialdehyde 2,1-aminomutase
VPPERLKGGSDVKFDHALYQGMLLNGVDLFHGGGLVSSVHSDEDIDQTIEAFRSTVVRMRQEGLFE